VNFLMPAVHSLQCESVDFTPLKSKYKCYFSKTATFKAVFYMHIWRLDLPQTAKFHSIIL